MKQVETNFFIEFNVVKTINQVLVALNMYENKNII